MLRIFLFRHSFSIGYVLHKLTPFLKGVFILCFLPIGIVFCDGLKLKYFNYIYFYHHVVIRNISEIYQIVNIYYIYFSNDRPTVIK